MEPTQYQIYIMAHVEQLYWEKRDLAFQKSGCGRAEVEASIADLHSQLPHHLVDHLECQWHQFYNEATVEELDGESYFYHLDRYERMIWRDSDYRWDPEIKTATLEELEMCFQEKLTAGVPDKERPNGKLEAQLDEQIAQLLDRLPAYMRYALRARALL